MTMTPVSSTVNSGVVTGKVPAEAGTIFFREVAGDGEHRNRSSGSGRQNIAMPSETLYQCVFAFRPAKAEPLLPVAEV